MTVLIKPHSLRCETCKKLWKPLCPYYAWIDKGGIGITTDSYIEFTSMVGCASHSDAGKAEQRIKDVIEMLEIQVGCSEMIFVDDVDNADEAYQQLRDEVTKAIALLRGKEE